MLCVHATLINGDVEGSSAIWCLVVGLPRLSILKVKGAQLGANEGEKNGAQRLGTKSWWWWFGGHREAPVGCHVTKHGMGRSGHKWRVGGCLRGCLGGGLGRVVVAVRLRLEGKTLVGTEVAGTWQGSLPIIGTPSRGGIPYR